jgi:hypothetical protein
MRQRFDVTGNLKKLYKILGTKQGLTVTPVCGDTSERSKMDETYRLQAPESTS